MKQSIQFIVVAWFAVCLTIGACKHLSAADEYSRSKSDAARDRRPHPIEMAIGKGDVNEVRRLLKEHPQLIHARFDRDQVSLLHVAAMIGKVEVAKVLLDAGADADAVEATGKTPLHIAAERADEKLIELLLTRRARIHAHDDVGRTPLITALLAGHVETAKRLIERGSVFDPNWRDLHGDPLIKYVVQRPHADAVKFVLAQDVDVNARGRHGDPPIYSADPKYIEALARKGADLNAKAASGETRLHGAAQTGDLELITLLAKLGANVNAITVAGYTPLDAGTEPVKALLRKHGAVSGRQFVRVASEGNVEKVKAILDRQPHFVSIIGPLQRAVARGDKAMAELLVARGADVNAYSPQYAIGPALHDAAARGSLELTRWLIRNKAKVNNIDHHRQTPLHWAIRNGHLDVAKALIESKSNVNAATNDGETPLHYAVQKGNHEAAALLIAAGANVNVQDTRTGKTPLHHAAWNNDIEMIKALVAAGAKVNLRDEMGWSPLDHAIDGKRTQAIELLRRHGAKSTRQPDP